MTGYASDASAEALTVHVGIVHGAGAVAHVCAATDADTLYDAMTAYVREWAPYQLWEEDAARVERLLARGRAREAVALYFDAEPQRWAPERLEIVATPVRDALASRVAG